MGDTMKNIDRKLGRFVQRLLAVLAFAGCVASIVFGVIVIGTAVFPGILALLLGAFFFWLGRRAWRDNSALGEIFNRDYNSQPDKQ
jgi:uncharacterized membrane protein YfbV (UPF0208 family)